MQEPTLRDLELLASISVSQARRLPHASRKLLLAGMLMARVRSDNNETALGLAELVKDGGLNRLLSPPPARGFLALEAALAETYLAVGLSEEAVHHANRLLSALPEVEDPVWRLRCLSVGAAAAALDGDHAAAQRHLDEVVRVRAVQGWPSDEVSVLDAFGELVVAFTALDRGRVGRLCGAMSALPQGDAAVAALRGLIRAMHHFALGDFPAAVAGAADVAHGGARRAGPPIFRMAGLALEAVLLVHRGTPAEAIALLRDVESPMRHSVCFDSVRASAFISLGDHRAALRATDDCVRARASHNRWMLPSPLLRRAVANMRLGKHHEAVADGVDALTHSTAVSPQLGLLVLPTQDLVALGVRVVAAQPGLLDRVRDLRASVRRLPSARRPHHSIPPLSPREHLIACSIRGDKSYSEVAGDLHVSTSTVKTQAHAVARKLGTRTRSETVERLESSGFYLLYGDTAQPANSPRSRAGSRAAGSRCSHSCG